MDPTHVEVVEAVHEVWRQVEVLASTEYGRALLAAAAINYQDHDE